MATHKFSAHSRRPWECRICGVNKTEHGGTTGRRGDLSKLPPGAKAYLFHTDERGLVGFTIAHDRVYAKRVAQKVADKFGLPVKVRTVTSKAGLQGTYGVPAFQLEGATLREAYRPLHYGFSGGGRK